MQVFTLLQSTKPKEYKSPDIITIGDSKNEKQNKKEDSYVFAKP